MENNPLILADMLAAEGSALAQMDLISESELQLYKQGVSLIGKAYPMFSGFAQESLDSFSDKKDNVQRSASYRRPAEDSLTMMYNLIGMMLRLSGEDQHTINQLIQLAERFS